MIRALISVGVTFLTAAGIWVGLGVFAPDIYVEKAFGIIVYPAAMAGIITAVILRRRRTRAAST